MEPLQRLEQSIRTLLEKYQQERAANQELTLRLADREEDLINAHAEIRRLRDENKKLLVARALSETDAGRDEAKRQITSIIGQIDRAMEVLRR